MNLKTVQIIGVPLDLGAGRRGVDMGPSAIRVAGLDDRIEKLGHTVRDWGDVTSKTLEVADVTDEHMRCFEAVFEVNRRLADVVEKTVRDGELPLLLGGDHSIAIGSIAGSTAHYAERGESIGVVWIDAHADMNTPQTSPSGNIHGMCLAVALGHGDERFVNLARPGPKLDPRKVALVGVRDLDPPERERMREAGLTVLTMRDIDERGMFDVMKEAIKVASSDTAGIHVQLDMDSVDPSLAPGTGTPVPGGLSYREAHLAMEMLADTNRLAAIDVVETNPALDVCNQTAELATQLILSLLGKRIFREAPRL